MLTSGEMNEFYGGNVCFSEKYQAANESYLASNVKCNVFNGKYRIENYVRIYLKGNFSRPLFDVLNNL